jgi:lambda repressor-like predicted transcriptional regulator
MSSGKQKKVTGPDARALLVRHVLLARGETLGQVARRCGLSRVHASNVLAGRRRNARLERALARLVGLAPERMFPPRKAKCSSAALASPRVRSARASSKSSAKEAKCDMSHSGGAANK